MIGLLDRVYAQASASSKCRLLYSSDLVWIPLSFGGLNMHM
jgi:hypothetical protein